MSEDRGTLAEREPHPASEIARSFLASKDLSKYVEPLASCAIEGNRLAEVCTETLRRVMAGEPVSDRYFMGLAWAVWRLENE